MSKSAFAAAAISVLATGLLFAAGSGQGSAAPLDEVAPPTTTTTTVTTQGNPWHG